MDQYIEEETSRFLAGTGETNRSSAGTNEGAPGRAVAGLSELNKLASEVNAVFVFLPAKGQRPTPAALAAINEAKEELEARFNIRIGLFTMEPGSADYEAMAAEMAVPGVVPIVKTGAKRFVSGELTERRIVEGFMAAVAAGGCCPLGYPGETE